MEEKKWMFIDLTGVDITFKETKHGKEVAVIKIPKGCLYEDYSFVLASNLLKKYIGRDEYYIRLYDDYKITLSTIRFKCGERYYDNHTLQFKELCHIFKNHLSDLRKLLKKCVSYLKKDNVDKVIIQFKNRIQLNVVKRSNKFVLVLKGIEIESLIIEQLTYENLSKIEKLIEMPYRIYIITSDYKCSSSSLIMELDYLIFLDEYDRIINDLLENNVDLSLLKQMIEVGLNTSMIRLLINLLNKDYMNEVQLKALFEIKYRKSRDFYKFKEMYNAMYKLHNDKSLKLKKGIKQ